MTALILLVGEQPAPNLLPLRHYHPAHVALVCTRFTRPRAERLAQVIGPIVEKPFCETDAFRVDEIKATLARYIEERRWAASDLIFNLTGGTKTMALAATEVARQSGARAFYYQTEDNQSLIHPYRFENGDLVCEAAAPIAATLTLDDYLRLYVGDYAPNTTPKLDRFEPMVFEALAASDRPGFEVMPSTFLKGVGGNVEVDVLVRHGNQVAVLEVKRKAGKDGIDQLNSVTEQRVLGTYTRKILVSATPLDKNNLALAAAYRIEVVVLESGRNGMLSPADQEKLIEAVARTLGAKR